MSGTIFTVAALVIGALIFGAGIYYLAKEKDDPESRKIYSIAVGVGVVIVIGAVAKVAIMGL